MKRAEKQDERLIEMENGSSAEIGDAKLVCCIRVPCHLECHPYHLSCDPDPR